MSPSSDSEMRWNRQAAMATTSALSEPVEAATRCAQLTRDMRRKASGFGGLARGMMRANDGFSQAMPGPLGDMTRQMGNAGLPYSFILAVTRNQIHAIEEMRQGDDLVAGRVLKSWDRAGFQARLGNERANAYRGVPDDRRVLLLFLPIEGGGSHMARAAARNAAAAGSPGFPHQVMVAKDAPSQRVIDALGATGGPGPNITIGGQSLQDIFTQTASAHAQAAPATSAPQPSTAQRLQELETLRATGVITDDEYTRKREQIISEL